MEKSALLSGFRPAPLPVRLHFICKDFNSTMLRPGLIVFLFHGRSNGELTGTAIPDGGGPASRSQPRSKGGRAGRLHRRATARATGSPPGPLPPRVGCAPRRSTGAGAAAGRAGRVCATLHVLLARKHLLLTALRGPTQGNWHLGSGLRGRPPGCPGKSAGWVFWHQGNG